MNRTALKLLFTIPYVLTWQFEYFFHLNSFFVVGILLFPILFVKKRDFRYDRSFVHSLLFGIVFVFMLIEPAIAYGKVHFSGLSLDFFPNLVYTLLFSLSIVTMNQGIVVRTLWRKPMLALTLSSVVYVLSVTPVQSFFQISGLAPLLLFNVSFLVVFNFLIGFMYLKSKFNQLSPLIFIFIYSFFLILNINVQVSKLFNLVWEIIALSVILYLSERVMKESILIKRAFKSSRTVFKKKDRTTPVIFAGIMVILVLIVVMPLVTHESHYVIADPTDSMYPEITPGSLLFVSHISLNEVRVGDIIVFKAPWENGTLFAHEVINITHSQGQEYFITKGINNPAKDPLPVPSQDLVGQVYFVLPYVGYVLIYSQLTAAVILLIAGALYFREARSN